MMSPAVMPLAWITSSRRLAASSEQTAKVPQSRSVRRLRLIASKSIFMPCVTMRSPILPADVSRLKKPTLSVLAM